MTAKPSSLGQVITFYSYKGGTGRSMALANVACLLAQRWVDSENVLMIDWDLEAPGLHQFFHGRFENPADKRKNLSADHLGLIDLFCEMKDRLSNNDFEFDIPESFFDDLEVDKYIATLNIPSLKLMPAGRFNDGLYSSRVNAFNWEDFFNSYPFVIKQFANYLRKKFKFTLIDSRTGYTDISGICTSLMPEKLVLVFTPNRQSLTGVVQLIEKSTDYRKQSDDLRPLVVFPLASRIENAEDDLQKDWRFGISGNEEVTGYQPTFETVLKSVYKLTECDLTKYFDEVQVQYKPRYSYGEEIAVLSERTEDRLSIAKSYEKCTERLIELEHPWENIDQEKLTDKDDDREIKAIPSRRLKVFIAHSSVDKPIVRDLYQRLTSEGWIDPWLDEERLLPGQDWDNEIERAVESADAIIVCLSENSLTKEGFVQKELRFMLDTALTKPEETIFIIPVRIDNCEPPRRLRMWQYVDYFPAQRRNEAYKKLLRSLEIRANKLGKSPTGKVFISYSHEDVQFVRNLANELKNADVDVWWDINELKGGADWSRTIQDALNESQYCIVVLTPDSVASSWVAQEYSYALANNIKVVPIYLRACNVPIALVSRQYVDFSNNPYKLAVRELKSVLGIKH
jgi:cellulose biosynthesis protein BcsQ